ncbi:type II toxin-antitoxin system HicB family antitoxin [Streptomyces sp. NPDC048612]|uniref:type II toxin-antitoxin system HicB family antitoxin n=1 Tax=Streptomyces sp. NPDC048612 TaxID=3365579 RepID=UPI00370FF8ED
MTAYRVTVHRTGDWWAWEVPDLPGAFSQVKRLDQAGEAARAAIAVMLGAAIEDVEVGVESGLPGEAVQARNAVGRADKAAKGARWAARQAMYRRTTDRSTGGALGYGYVPVP